MSKNAMAGAITLCGVGLCTIGGGLMMQSGSAAHAGSMPLAATAAIAAATHTQAGPTIVWMGVTLSDNHGTICYNRMWSDGRIEMRWVGLEVVEYSNCGNIRRPCATSYDWIEVPPPPGGNGFACRSDINGDRLVDGADLAFVLNSWGQQGGCEPDATYPCLNLGDLAIAAAMK